MNDSMRYITFCGSKRKMKFLLLGQLLVWSAEIYRGLLEEDEDKVEDSGDGERCSLGECLVWNECSK